jgi:hypothetical protein
VSYIYLKRTYGKRNIIQVMGIRDKLNKLKLEEGDMTAYLKKVCSLQINSGC